MHFSDFFTTSEIEPEYKSRSLISFSFHREVRNRSFNRAAHSKRIPFFLSSTILGKASADNEICLSDKDVRALKLMRRMHYSSLATTKTTLCRLHDRLRSPVLEEWRSSFVRPCDQSISFVSSRSNTMTKSDL